MQHFADGTIIAHIFLFNFLLLDHPFHTHIMQCHFICQIFSLGKNCRKEFISLHIASIDVAALCGVANCDRLIIRGVLSHWAAKPKQKRTHLAFP